ncbi:MAG: beta-N-acetylhexosaminidase [Bacteroidia bacterium]|nr:beta-N-acetylhexosaminidase [Bacteroidia bacterium]
MIRKFITRSLLLFLPPTLFLFPLIRLSAQTPPIVPLPQHTEFRSGSFMLPDRPFFRLSLSEPAEVLIEQLVELSGRETHEPDPAIWLGIPDQDNDFKQICKNIGIKEEDQWGEEGYSLVITSKQIFIAANTPAGVFYGLQSLRQLTKAYLPGHIPCMKIIDWPTFSFRGIMDDISRGPLPKTDFMKAQIRRFASLKINYMTFYIEHVIKTQKYGDFSPKEGITTDEWKELSDYALKYHIRLIGSFQSLGHFSNILAFPQYAHLGATAQMLKPGDPEVLHFLTDIYSEMYPAFSSDIFAINCDEAWDLGRGSQKRLADSIGIAGIYASHVNPLIRHVQQNGHRALMWGDIALSHPEVLDLIPKETIIGTWDYSANVSFSAFIDPFKEKGFSFIVCPGVLNSHRIMPDFNQTLVNIRNFANEGREKGAMGVLNTIWDDGGSHFFNRDWYGVSFGADQSWNPNQEEIMEYDRRFSLSAYGDAEARQPQFLHSMNGLAAFAPTQEMNDDMLWQTLLPARGNSLPLNMSGWREIEEQLNEAGVLLRPMYKKAFGSEWRYWQFTWDQYWAASESRKKIVQAANYYHKACLLQHSNRDSTVYFLKMALKPIDDLSREWARLRDEFQYLWFEENRHYWLDHALAPYNQRLEELNETVTLLETAGRLFMEGHFLPPPNEVRLAVEETAGQFFTYWLTAGPFPISTPHIPQADFLTDMGGEKLTKPIPGQLFKTPDGRTLIWEKHASPLSDRIDFAALYDLHEEAVAYAYCQIESSSDQSVRATFGSNDGIEVFCNGALVFRNLTKRSLIPDENECMLSLKEGTNHILLKVEQWKGEWGFSFRLPDKIVRNHKQKYQILN